MQKKVKGTNFQKQISSLTVFTLLLNSAWTNQKITAELEDRQRVIQTTFKRSGTGPIQKTYSYDPTKQKSPTAQSIIQRGFKDTKKST